MAGDGDGPGGPAGPDLRERARRRVGDAPTDVSGWTGEDLRSLVTELELHQEELRIQNEELRAAHSAASLARDRYRDLFERAPVGYLILDRTGRIREANLPAGALLGTGRNELEGADLAAFIAAQSQDAWFRLRRTFAPAMEPRSEEVALARGDRKGAQVVRLEVVPEAGTDPADPRFRCALSDVSARAKEQRFNRTLLDSLGEGVFGVDTEGRFTFLNPVALRLFGFASQEAVLGQHSHRLTHHTDAEGEPYPASECPIERVMTTGVPLEACQERFWRSDGTSFPVEVYASPLGGTGGGVTGAVVVFDDISTRKEREAVLLKYRAAFEQSRDAVVFLDPEGHVLDANPAALAMFRVPGLEAVRGAHPCDFSPTHQHDGRPSREAADARLREVLANGQASFEWRLLPTAGETFPAEVLLSRIDRPDGPIVEAVVRDVTEAKEAFEQVRQARNRARKYFDVARVMMLVLDPEGRVAAINRSGCELLGLRHEAVLGADWFERFLPADIREEAREVFRRLLHGAETEAASGENTILTGQGERRLVAFRNAVLRDGEGRIEGILSSGMDITEHRELEAALRYRAHHDPLTGLLNRVALEEALDHEFGRFQRYGGTFALVMFDLDHFKAVNDHYGHATGDRVLQGVTERARQELRSADLLGRWGGEEFVAFLPETDAEEAAALAERIRRAIAGISYDEVGKVTVSLGVAELAAGEARSNLLKRVDDALYRAKNAGRNRVLVATG